MNKTDVVPASLGGTEVSAERAGKEGCQGALRGMPDLAHGPERILLGLSSLEMGKPGSRK